MSNSYIERGGSAHPSIKKLVLLGGGAASVGVESHKRGGGDGGRARMVHRGVDYRKLELPHIRNMLFQEHYDLQLKWSLTKSLLVRSLLLY